MKKTISLLVLLFCITLSIQLSAQTFTLEQFAAFNKLGMADFKKEMKSLNYRFYDKTEGLGFVLSEYESPDYQSKIGKFEYEDHSEDRIEYEFKTKKEYDQYVKTILNSGYKETEKGKTITKESYVDYYKNKEHIRLVTPKAGDKNPYTILVFK
ncbi:hypothetical protein BBH99_08660 [Chryseobacterium contaminans]|uniref:Omptin family protein n=1 Tax=Chryseobacterium contaminans TaxID=1423959 RepID=A0A1M7BJY2_9FLAO|nr:hypothetical protein [Chryseobacterium contaminans]OCA78349.1 hypothetical protein BBH99_08660 [Chryseobacterium contaminans]SHL55233.1 hypothetical protein SAMN05444407_104422 [Chryseobacterium contaminans]